MTLKAQKEISGRERLAQLGPVFTAQDLQFRFSMSSGTAQVTLHRWSHRDGLIRRLGGRSQVYFNLHVDPNWHTHFEFALKLAVPHAITIGQSAYSHGWTTQLPTARHLAVPTSVQLYGIEGCQFHSRRRDWFLAIAQGIQYKAHTIPELRPAWALADALFAKSAYRNGKLPTPRTTDNLRGASSVVPDPDELYVDDCSEKDAREFRKAVESLKLYYGFSALPVDDSWLIMKHAYASAHAAVLGPTPQEIAAAPGL